jgi:septal ring factor EnvC (AmiA/AmiB activator)
MIKRSYIYILVFLLTVFLQETFSQDLSGLKKQRSDIEKKISLTNKLISQAKKNKTATINDIKLIQSQIKNRNDLIKVYQETTAQLNDSINSLNVVIEQLTKEIEELKKEYEKLIWSAYKRKLQYNELNFFLGSQSFNEAYRKFILINEYNKYRRKQGEVLIKSRDDLNSKKQKLNELKKRNEENITRLEQEKIRLQKEINNKNLYLNKFRKQERKLRKDVKKYNSSLKDLDNKITEIINSFKNTKYASSDFGKMRGKLKWPVSKGVIISKFGIHEHPVLKNVKIKNNGIDIKVLSGSDVFAVFDGVVTRVVVIPGYNRAVIIRHGKYLTVYANLKNVAVKRGQKIKTGQKIGTVYSGEGENSNVVHFEIWEEKNKQNPEKWLIL